jgi:hypothetical protein
MTFGTDSPLIAFMAEETSSFQIKTLSITSI